MHTLDWEHFIVKKAMWDKSLKCFNLSIVCTSTKNYITEKLEFRKTLTHTKFSDELSQSTVYICIIHPFKDCFNICGCQVSGHLNILAKEE